MEFKFLHAADIHLDSPLKGLTAYEGAPISQFQNATRVAFSNLVSHAIETGVAFVIIAGDLYDGDWPDFSTGLFLIKELEQLNQAGIKAVILFGNHDTESKITKSLPWPANAFRFGHKAPETIMLDELGVAIHGQSYARMDVMDNLASSYPKAQSGRLNIGVLHTALEGNARHASYAPCSLEQLQNHGYDYWALGHVHAHAILNRDPWVVFPGNLQGRHVRETGAKGCVSVTVRDGQIITVEQVILDVVRWLEVEVDASGHTDVQELRKRCNEAVNAAISEQSDGRPSAVRVRLVGETAIHSDIISNYSQFEAELQATTLGMQDCWLESIKVRTAQSKAPAVGVDDGTSAVLNGILAAAESDPDLAGSISECLRPLQTKLPADLSTRVESYMAEDYPLLQALQEKDMSKLIRLVLPDLQNAQGGS